MSSANQKAENRQPQTEDTAERVDPTARPPQLVVRSEAGRERLHRAWLSRGLRDLFQDTVNEPIPESFLTLLEELERAEREKEREKPRGDT